MRIGLMIATSLPGTPSMEEMLALTVRAESLGLATAWLSGRFESTTFAAIAATRTSRIELATGIVQTYPRHPAFLAQQALTVQAASGGRFTLGVGVGARAQMEGALGFPFHPARHLEEYLVCLGGLLAGETVTFKGQEYRISGYRVPAADDAKAPPVIVAALGERSLRVAGAHADGTTIWLGGPRYLARFAVPRISDAARAAGRPAPRIAAGLPICVTSDAAAAKERARVAFARYAQQPTYRAILDHEGVAGAEEVGIFGDEATTTAAIRALESAGATDFAASVFAGSPEESERTYALLSALARA